MVTFDALLMAPSGKTKPLVLDVVSRGVQLLDAADNNKVFEQYQYDRIARWTCSANRSTPGPPDRG